MLAIEGPRKGPHALTSKHSDDTVRTVFVGPCAESPWITWPLVRAVSRTLSRLGLIMNFKYNGRWILNPKRQPYEVGNAV